MNNNNPGQKFTLEYIRGGYIFRCPYLNPPHNECIVPESNIVTHIGTCVVELLGGETSLRGENTVLITKINPTNVETSDTSSSSPTGDTASPAPDNNVKGIVPIMEQYDFMLSLKGKSVRGYIADGKIMFFGDTARAISNLTGIKLDGVQDDKDPSLIHYYISLPENDMRLRYLGVLAPPIIRLGGDWRSAATAFVEKQRERITENIKSIHNKDVAKQQKQSQEKKKK